MCIYSLNPYPLTVESAHMTNANTNTMNTPPKILQALVDMQVEISTTGIAKSLSATDKTGKELYKARSIDSVYNLLSPIFAKHGVVIGVNCLSKEREAVQTKFSIQYQTFVTVEYTFTSCQDGSSHSVTVIGEAFDHSDKGIAKAMAMAFKYACFQVFCIPVCDDPDATVHERVSNQEYQDSRQHTQHTTTQVNNGQQRGQNNHQQNNQRRGQNNNQQQNNQQQNNQQRQFITRDQANELIQAVRQAGVEPKKLLKRYNVEKFSELTIQAFSTTMASLNRFLMEQQHINQQQGNFQHGNGQGNYS